ncbi:helix-turn-helix domain-containing protein [Halovenus sp. WSH3]|uniref:Helix-turn-helix domain-containing protein n=1 Tax=Halovenus carboxidivorans TaxID=2692199 RepID=A0A6B0T7W0_9EURY|nr:thiamine-phosphate synthase family protein [Halovenus carboxidivorans]MXR51281.1 helix-turn-helix domain-containing protein [Halovenus carboxidivorans]
MKFVEELVVEEFLPTFRSLLAEALRERGLTQIEVADQLGISQSAVSKYVHGDVARNEAIMETDRVRELVDRLADGLATGEMTTAEALIEAEICIRELERGGVLADLHAEAVPEIDAYDGEFAIHDPDSRLREANRARASVRRGLRILQNTPGFPRRIPAVGSNLVECLPDAETIDDVVGVPGRLLSIRGQLTVPGEPEFGVSQHVASVLLAARAAGSDARATLNVSYDEQLVETLTDEGQVAVEFDAEADLDTAIETALSEQPDASVLYQTGGYGVEPVLYILGSDAPAVATTVRDLDD